MRALASSTRRVTAIGIEDVPSVKIGGLGSQEQERTCEVGRFAKPALRYAREKSFAHRGRTLVVLVHPRGERRAEHRRSDGIHGNSRVTPFAAERLGHAVDR